MLVLPIKKEWFDMIVAGDKKEEYKEIKPYYDKVLGNVFIGFPFTKAIVENLNSIKSYDASQIKNAEIIFRNGYKYNSPKVKCLCTLDIGQGKEEWGARPNKEYYVINILEILEVKRYGK